MGSIRAESESKARLDRAPAWVAEDWRDRLEWTALGLFAVLFLLALVVRSADLPMQIWDESRNANNALEAAMYGHWLAPTYNGAVDHWNTKPPLLIWMIASAMSLGLPPLWALRLPSLLAAAGTLGLIWATLRFGLRDRLAAAIAVALVLSSPLYMGWHGARTGDFDCLETIFVVGYVVSFWKLLRGHAPTGWFVAVAACVIGAVLTKGIAGMLPAPGLALCLIVKRKRALELIRDPRSWLCGGFAVAASLAYYGARELYDRGYIAAVLENEVGGRFLRGQGNHDLLFHLEYSVGLEPALLLSPLSLGLFLRRARDEVQDLALIALAAGASLLLVISLSQTKLTWYALPLIPILSLPSALGASEWLRLAFARDWLPMRGAAAVAGAGLVVILPAGQTARSFRLPDHFRPDHQMPIRASQLLYGRAMAEIQRQGIEGPVAIVDSGFPGGPPDQQNYNPILDFYLKRNARSGQFDRVRPPQALAPSSAVLTCDPKSSTWLAATYILSAPRNVAGCELATVVRVRR